MKRSEFVTLSILVGLVSAIIICICMLANKAALVRVKCDIVCMGGYQYEMVVNELNEPVKCGDDYPEDSPIKWETK